MHPTLEIKGTKSNKLLGKKIVLGITGSIAAVETPKLCRELVRHGADVFPVMSDKAEDIITPESIHFGAGRPPVTRLDGAVQHVEFFSTKEKADLLLVSPCTANTISKIACGIDDTPVTTCATTAIGAGVPVIIVPAMDLSMWKHPVLCDNIKKLEKLGIRFIRPMISENKAKIIGFERIVTEVKRELGKCDLAGKKVLVIAGSTEEYIDDIRMISNKSSGETGVSNAIAAYERGADVELWMGRCSVAIPEYIKTRRFSSTAELRSMVEKIGKYDIILVPAAVSDYTVQKTPGKMPSDRSKLVLTLHKTQKILPLIRKRSRAYIVASKLESGVSREELISKAKKRMDEHDIEMIVANDINNVARGKNAVAIITRKGCVSEITASKEMVADEILDRVIADVRKK